MAQSGEKSERVRFGVKGGMHLSNMHYSNLDQYSPDWISNGVGGIFGLSCNSWGIKFSQFPSCIYLC